MAESFEPKQPIGGKIVAFFLHGAIAFALIYLVFIYDGSLTGDTITPGQMRSIIERFRENQRQRMVREVGEMRKMLDEMYTIREQWLKQAGVNVKIDEVLERFEKQQREMAQTEVEDLKLDKVYDVGRSIEQDMVTVYREYLAARKVEQRPDYRYDEAYESTSGTPRVTRPELDNDALYRDITTTAEGGGLKEFKGEITRSTIEMREMVENCKKLLAFTKKSSSDPQEGIEIDPGSDEMAILQYRGPELMPDEINMTHRHDEGNFDAIPGRRLVSGGPAAEWMYVNSWYIVGPFQSDRRRQNLDTRFGPEASINLDDVFTGEKGIKIPWEFKKVGFSQRGRGRKDNFWRIEPKRVSTYVIYYAFTEIYSDVPRKVWIATGTDDYGKLWINDKLVWTSPKDRKPYNATENVQPVELKQGQNKVLYRIENAGGTMGFSLLISLKQAAGDVGG